MATPVRHVRISDDMYTWLKTFSKQYDTLDEALGALRKMSEMTWEMESPKTPKRNGAKPTFPVVEGEDRFEFYCEPCGRAFSSATKQAEHVCPPPRVFGDGSGMMIDLNGRRNEMIHGDGDGELSVIEPLAQVQGPPVESVYANEPHGIPFVTRLGDEGMVLVAAGKEQVERYHAAATDEEYLAGEADGPETHSQITGLNTDGLVLDEETGEIIEGQKYWKKCFHNNAEGNQCARDFETTNKDGYTCVPCAMAGHAAVGDCRLCPGSDTKIDYELGALPSPAGEQVPVGEHGCRCVHCGAAFRSRKGYLVCQKCLSAGHVNVEAKSCVKCQSGQVA